MFRAVKLLTCPTDQLPSPLNYLPNHVQPLTHHPFGFVAQPRSTDRHADNFDTRIGCFVRFTNRASSTTSLLGSAECIAAGRDVPAAAPEDMYESLLSCTTAPSVCLLLCNDHALQCPPWLPGILCDCASVDYPSLSTSYNKLQVKKHGSPLLELLCKCRDVVATRVDLCCEQQHSALA